VTEMWRFVSRWATEWSDASGMVVTLSAPLCYTNSLLNWTMLTFTSKSENMKQMLTWKVSGGQHGR